MLLTKFLASVYTTSNVFHILEIGGGTGATTKHVMDALRQLNIQFTYTFTDISASLVAAARKKFSSYENMIFMTLDVEKEPPRSLSHKYHTILSTNCIHATRDVVASARNIRYMLRNNGFVSLVEFTQNLFWFDLVFGLLDGWWAFMDGRQHVLGDTAFWSRSLRAAGFEDVLWTDGASKEARTLRIITAFVAARDDPRSTQAQVTAKTDTRANTKPIKIAIDKQPGTRPIKSPSKQASYPREPEIANVILMTGSTGSLGTHLLAHVASLPDIARIFCLVRIKVARVSHTEPRNRQWEAFAESRLSFSPEVRSKIQIFECETTKPFFGLSDDLYNQLRTQVTHILHCAWPMNIKAKLPSFDGQLDALNNLITLAKDVHITSPSIRPRLMFISSIAAVGQYPKICEESLVPEAPLPGDKCVNEIGYAQAKLACERIIERAALAESEQVEVSYVRIGQMSGSSRTGFWNKKEHVPALIRSSQTIGHFPFLQGTLSWIAVDLAAHTIADCLLGPNPMRLVYHVENPVRQPWSEVITVLESELNMAGVERLPYDGWLEAVLTAPFDDNPVRLLEEFFKHDFIRMACGSVVLGTEQTRRASTRLQDSSAISLGTITSYVDYWRAVKFLH